LGLRSGAWERFAVGSLRSPANRSGAPLASARFARVVRGGPGGALTSPNRRQRPGISQINASWRRRTDVSSPVSPRSTPP